MNRSIVYLLGLVVGLLLSGCVSAKNCELDNPDLEAMPAGLVSIVRDDGSTFELKVKMATEAKSRAAGFQRICEATIEAMPILFVFPAAVIPNFHMNNVVAPIDIAFIRDNGSVDSFHAMKPYVIMSTDKPRYSPSDKVIAALEVHEGFFDKNRIDEKANFSWKHSNSE